jgi:hypothetical protein
VAATLEGLGRAAVRLNALGEQRSSHVTARPPSNSAWLRVHEPSMTMTLLAYTDAMRRVLISLDRALLL